MQFYNSLDCDKDVSEGEHGNEANLPEETWTGKKNVLKEKNSSNKCQNHDLKKSKVGCHNSLSISEMAGESACYTSSDPDHTPSKQSKTEYESDDNLTRFQMSQSSDIFSINGYIPSQAAIAFKSSQTSNVSCSRSSYKRGKGCGVLENDHTVINPSQKCSIEGKFQENSIPSSSSRSEVWDYHMDQVSDSGYVSNYSTNGYSDTDRGPMELGSQMELENAQEESIGGSQGDGDLEDLLTQFQKFFKNRFESELETFRSSMSNLLEEQQNHIRQIVHTAIAEQSSQSQNSADSLFLECTQTDPANCEEAKAKTKPTNSVESGTRPMLSKQDFDLFASLSSFQIQCSKDQSSREKKDKVFKLMGLACSVSTLLAKHQFRV